MLPTSNGLRYIPEEIPPNIKNIVSSSGTACKQTIEIIGLPAVFFIPIFKEDDIMGRYRKRKDGRYATTIMAGYKPDGKPNNIFISAKTEKELKNKIIETKMKIKSGEAVKESDMLLKDYTKSWMQTYKSSAGINTKAMYNNVVNHYIIPELGYFPINKIHRSDIQKLINDNQDHPRTCEIIKMTMVQILNSAVDDKLLQENVAKKIVLPKHHKSERRPLTDTEKEAIKKADLNYQERAFITFLFYFGLRRGEALALTKSDVNIKRKMLTVNKTVVFDVNTPIIKIGAKSDAGNREIPIPESAQGFLTDFLNTVDTFYLFPGKNHDTLSKTQYVRMWNHIIKKMNDAVTTDNEKKIGTQSINGLTAHIFRHNYCTMLYYSGISQKKAVELMGHSDIKMIMEVYAHLDEQKESVQEKLDKAIAL